MKKKLTHPTRSYSIADEHWYDLYSSYAHEYLL